MRIRGNAHITDICVKSNVIETFYDEKYWDISYFLPRFNPYNLPTDGFVLNFLFCSSLPIPYFNDFMMLGTELIRNLNAVAMVSMLLMVVLKGNKLIG